MKGLRRSVAGLALLVGLWPVVASAAAPPVPGKISYQGLLLDGGGQPRTGNVALTLRIYDALAGGSLLYKQVFPVVPLTDGVFSLQLGPAGEATDAPDDPLSTSLADALAADLGATGPDRFLELTVGAEGPLPRTQILSVPYAVHAETADHATTADQATTADTANDAGSVGGLDASFVTQFYEHTNLDGENPPNTHPDEGLADVDGDGMANFIDPDNDDDGLSDGTELSDGTALNLVTPTLDAFLPAAGDADLTQLVTLQGTNFEAGMSVSFGSESPAPLSVTATSADVSVGPQAPGSVGVTITRANGESASSSFEFLKIIPTITGFSPEVASDSQPTLVTIFGTNFQPDMSVVIGSESPSPVNVTPTSAEVIVGPQSGIVPASVTLVNGNSAAAQYQFGLADGAPLAHTVPVSGHLSFDVKGVQQVIVGAEAGYGVDTDADRVPDLLLPFASNSQGSPGQIAVGWDPNGNVAGLTCRTTGVGNDCTVEFVTDSDGDFELEDEVGVLVDTIAGGPLGRIESPSIAWDSSGHAVVGFLRRQVVTTEVVVAHDLDGDGLFTGLNEVQTLDTVGSPVQNAFEVATGPVGQVAIAYQGGVQYDPEGDGTYVALAGGGGTCIGADYDAAGDLVVVFGGSSGVMLKRPIPDTSEVVTDNPVTACDVVGGAGGVTVVHNGAGLSIVADRDSTGSLESTVVLETPTTATVLELRRASDGRAHMATQDRVLLDPIPVP